MRYRDSTHVKHNESGPMEKPNLSYNLAACPNGDRININWNENEDPEQ